VLEWLKETFGGGVYEQKRYDGRKRPIYVWVAQCGTAAEFLRMTLPYLRVKRKQAEIALELQSRLGRFRGGAGGSKPIPSEEFEAREGLRLALSAAKTSDNPYGDDPGF